MRADADWGAAAGDNPFVALPHGAKVGTGSVRRAAFLHPHRPDVHVQDLRGNVDSRIQRLLAGEFDALVLAMAGLERLARLPPPGSGLSDDDVRVLPIPIEQMLPAVAQGTLAIEMREGDAQVLALLKPVDHSETHAALIAERAFLRVFGAGCQAPIAAHARIAGGMLHLRGAVGLPDGSVFAQGEVEGPVDLAQMMGATLGQRVLRAGGHTILGVMQQGERPLQGKRIAITRANERSESLAVKLSALGAIPVNVPVIDHAPPEDMRAFNLAMQDLCGGVYDWAAFTSATAIEVVAAWLSSQDCAWPASTQIAVVGEVTARACMAALHRGPNCMPEHYDAASLATTLATMNTSPQSRVLLPNADIAQPALQNALQAQGMRVDRVIAYRTVCRDAAIAGVQADAILFTSGSTVSCYASQFEERGALAVCIGRQTAQAAERAGFARIAIADAATEAGLIDALLRAAKEGALNDT
jgi:uroporphyrinogen-III synthase